MAQHWMEKPYFLNSSYPIPSLCPGTQLTTRPFSRQERPGLDPYEQSQQDDSGWYSNDLEIEPDQSYIQVILFNADNATRICAMVWRCT